MRHFVTYFPPTAASLCLLIGWFMPANSVWTYGIQAVLLSAWPWWMLIWGMLWIGAALRWGWRWSVGIVCLLCCGIPPVGPSVEQGTGVVVANVNAFTGQEKILEQAATSWDADVVVLIEKRIEQIPSMNRAADDFGESVPRPSHHMAIFCDIDADCDSYVSPQIGSATMAMSYGLLRYQNHCWVFIHAPPPIPHDTTGMRPYLNELNAHIDSGVVRDNWAVCRVDDPVIMVGDLNAVPHSEPYNYIMQFGLSDQQAFSGLWRLSWPAGGGWINFPLFRLDHLLAHPDVALAHEQFRVPDSDHKALRVQLLND